MPCMLPYATSSNHVLAHANSPRWCQMQCIVFTPPHAVPKEAQIVNRMLQAGLGTLHLRKPAATVEELIEYIEAIDAPHRYKVVVHQHHPLAKEFHLRVSPTSILSHSPRLAFGQR